MRKAPFRHSVNTQLNILVSDLRCHDLWPYFFRARLLWGHIRKVQPFRLHFHLQPKRNHEYSSQMSSHNSMQWNNLTSKKMFRNNFFENYKFPLHFIALLTDKMTLYNQVGIVFYSHGGLSFSHFCSVPQNAGRWVHGSCPASIREASSAPEESHLPSFKATLD